LPARRFIFGDGKRRVGFLLSSVDRFLHAHQDQVTRGTNFSQVGDDEREQILRRARRLATTCGCCTQEISRRIGRKLNRSPLTVLHTIRKHDEERPTEAIFATAAQPIGDDDRARILRGYRHGMSLAALARRYERRRTAIYRVVLEERLAKLNRRKAKFIDDALYHQPDASSVIEHLADQQNTLAAADQRPEDRRIPRDLPPYLQDLYRTPLLTPPQERALFLKFNFHKFQFVQARRKLEPQFMRARDLNLLEGHLRRAIDTKNAIVRANLRLVVSIARKHLRPGTPSGRLSLMELISEGNITLMRAVESFDVHRGNRFSTYATLALMKGFARSVPVMLADSAGGRALLGAGAKRVALAGELSDPRPHEAPQRLAQRDEVRQLVSQLNQRERAVLLAHFGIGESSRDATNATPESYEQLGQRLGLSTQRVRQIERAALEKLRASVR
jgi:RNA polymerase sigma factor (sigma-70 family)